MNMRAARRTTEGKPSGPLVTGVLRRKCGCGTHTVGGATCAGCREKHETLRRSGATHAAAAEAPAAVHEVLRSPGRPLDAPTRSFMESRFRHDFSRVRVHADARAAESARAVGASAYTVGHNVVFGAGRYSPETAAGKRLLAHELTHTIQQRDGLLQGSPLLEVGAPESAAEKEADAVADAVLARGEASPVGGRPVQLARQDAGVGDSSHHDAGAVAGVSTPAPASAPPPSPLPTDFEANTELGGLSVGNFDFLFRNCEVLISVRVRFQFEDGITPAEQTAFRARFFGAVHGVWGNSGYHLTGSERCPCRNVPIRIVARETTGSNYHKLVDVERAARRESVISDMNVSLHTTRQTIAHEFGHVLGLYDEYDGGWLENRMFWHRNRPDDPRALMNEGSELRERYFSHYRARVQETARAGCEYRVSSPVPPVSAPPAAGAPSAPAGGTPPAPTTTTPPASGPTTRPPSTAGPTAPRRPAGLPCPAAANSPSSPITELFFDLGDSSLSRTQKATIRSFVASWRALGGSAPVRVDGYASVDGTDANNWRLSCARAQAVEGELVAPTGGGVAGVPRTFITRFAHGETGQFGTLPRNRRAIISSTAPLPPATAPTTPSTLPVPAFPPKVWFWIHAFIPNTVGGAFRARSGPFAGRTVFPSPPHPFHLNSCFETDDRGFSSAVAASSRVRAVGEIDTVARTLTAGATSDLTFEIDCTTGAHKCSRMPSPSVSFGLLPPALSPPGGFRVAFAATANDPCVAGSPDLAIRGAITIERHARTFNYFGATSLYPAFEMYASFGGPPRVVFTQPPLIDSPLALLAPGANVRNDTITF